MILKQTQAETTARKLRREIRALMQKGRTLKSRTAKLIIKTLSDTICAFVLESSKALGCEIAIIKCGGCVRKKERSEIGEVKVVWCSHVMSCMRCKPNEQKTLEKERGNYVVNV